MYQIVFFVPKPFCETVKQALFKAGAGAIGNYDQCAWQVLGSGQFRPLKNSDAHIGEINQLENVLEYRVEMVCQNQYIKKAVQALLESHPYQTPAYSVYLIKTVDEFYNHHVVLIISAEVDVYSLYAGHQLAFEFQRCISRLLEMQSKEYLQKAHHIDD